MNMRAQTKLALGSVMGTLGALGIVLSLLLEWSMEPCPWGYLLAFALGVIAGLGATFVLSGLGEFRRSN